jgi:hypothetical protein
VEADLNSGVGRSTSGSIGPISSYGVWGVEERRHQWSRYVVEK